MRVGIGHDVHRLVADRKLVLGGVEIPFEKGLAGYSDADVLVHAACDALLGAAGLGDIGCHFPDSDSQYKNIYSINLLERCVALIARKGFGLINMDATLFAERPRLAPFFESMKTTMATAMGVENRVVNIKATTTEGLGPFGRGEGIGAACIVLIGRNRSTGMV